MILATVFAIGALVMLPACSSTEVTSSLGSSRSFPSVSETGEPCGCPQDDVDCIEKCVQEVLN